MSGWAGADPASARWGARLGTTARHDSATLAERN